MQQAARVSQRTAFFHLGKLIEVEDTEKIFRSPEHEQTEAYVTGRYGQEGKMTEEHIVTSFDDELRELTDGLIHLGGLAQIALANVEKSLKMNDHDLA